MNWFEALVLGVLQGLTEFLPISSSGHLVVVEGAFAALGERSTSGSDQLFFNVMLHLGTLGAILFFYREAAARIAGTAFGRQRSDVGTDRRAIYRAGALIVVATLPAVVVGLFFKEEVERATASPSVAGFGFFVTAAILLATQRLREGGKSLDQTLWRDALLVGTAQAVAIMPGISRSGTTIAAALALGFSRPWAVTFSLLMAIPAILGAGVLEARDVDPSSLTAGRIAMTSVAMLVSGLVGYAAIVWLFRIVRTNRLWYFSVYLVVLGALVLASFPFRGGTDAGPARSSPVDWTDRGLRVDPDPQAGRGPRPVALDRPDGGPPRPGASGAGDSGGRAG